MEVAPAADGRLEDPVGGHHGDLVAGRQPQPACP